MIRQTLITAALFVLRPVLDAYVTSIRPFPPEDGVVKSRPADGPSTANITAAVDRPPAHCPPIDESSRRWTEAIFLWMDGDCAGKRPRLEDYRAAAALEEAAAAATAPSGTEPPSCAS